MMMMQQEKERVDSEVPLYECKQCHSKLGEYNFFKYKDKSIMPICKECITSSLKEDDPNTWMNILKELDRPYIEEEWDSIREKHPDRPLINILARYIAKMNLYGYKNYTYLDGPRLHQWWKESRKKHITNLGDNGIIVLEYDSDKLDLDTVRETHRVISQTFPNNKVISLPSVFSFQTLKKEEALEMIENLKKFLDGGQN